MAKTRKFCKKLKIELGYDPAFPFLGIYSKVLKSGYQRDIRILMFTTLIFTAAKMWNNLHVCLYVNELRKYGISYCGTLLRLEKKDFCHMWQMNEPGENYSKWNKSVTKDQHCMILPI